MISVMIRIQIYHSQSVHFDHSGIEIRTIASHSTRMVADTANSHNVQQTHQNRNQTSKADYSSRSRHEIFKGIMAIFQLTETIYIIDINTRIRTLIDVSETIKISAVQFACWIVLVWII